MRYLRSKQMFQTMIRSVYRNFRMTPNLTSEAYHPQKIKLMKSRNIKESSWDHSVQNVCTPFYRQLSPLYHYPPPHKHTHTHTHAHTHTHTHTHTFYLFSRAPRFLQHFFHNIAPIKYRIKTNIYS